MKDFAGSRATYYSLAREKLKGKHPRILNVLLILVLISMAGFAAFLLSDILSFGLNSDHGTFLVGLEHQDSIDRIMSIINWNEKSIKPAVLEDPKEQKGGFNNLLENNSSQNATELNISNSSRMANSFSASQASSGSTIGSTASNTNPSKLVSEKKAPLIKMHHSSSSGTSISQPLKQKDIQGNQKYANITQLNSTQLNSTQLNSSQLNSSQLNSSQVSNIQVNNTSRDQLQIKETSTINSPINGVSTGQSQVNPTSANDSLMGLSQTNVAEIDSSQTNSSLNTSNPREGRTGEDSLDKAALPNAAADSPIDPTKDASAEKPPLKIEFKMDPTTCPGSEDSPSGDHTNSGTVSDANAPSNSKSPARGEGGASLKKPSTTAANKAQKLQEIKYQKISNQNRLVENAKKRQLDREKRTN